MPKKKTTNENDYEKLKLDYINICKEITSVQNKLNDLDKKREKILLDIRNLQTEKSNEKNKILLNNKNKLVLNNSNVVIKKPMKSTDMETDDSSSENLSDYIDISDNESE